MARRRKQKSLLDIALTGSWEVSATFTILAIIATYIVLPKITNPFIHAVAPQLQLLGLGVILLFGLIAAFKLTSELKKTNSAQKQTLTTHPLAVQVVQESDTPKGHPNAWSLWLIKEIEWKRFEELCTAYYLEKGIKAETTSLGADGGIDIKLYQDNSNSPTAIAQCKSWYNKAVGVKEIREFLGVMSHEKIPKGFYITTGEYTVDAKAIANANKITLITGELLLMMILRLPEASQNKLLALATEGDYTTPSCPSCGTKMIHRTGSKGDFWGCSNYPKCRQKLHLRKN